MDCDLGGGVLARAEIDYTRSFVCSGADDVFPILYAFLVILRCDVNSEVLLTGDQSQLKTGASCSKNALPLLPPVEVIS